MLNPSRVLDRHEQSDAKMHPDASEQLIAPSPFRFTHLRVGIPFHVKKKKEKKNKKRRKRKKPRYWKRGKRCRGEVIVYQSSGSTRIAITGYFRVCLTIVVPPPPRLSSPPPGKMQLIKAQGPIFKRHVLRAIFMQKRPVFISA
jgi:hypothetical protein